MREALTVPAPEAPALIPRPHRLEGRPAVNPVFTALTVTSSECSARAAALLQCWAGARPGLAIVPAASQWSARVVFLDLAPTLGGPEAYDLEITPEGVSIRAATPEGHLHAVQTLLALASGDEGAHWPAITIQDAPHFSWRGLLLDSCRHFISKPAILRLIDQMAALKMNRLHWHLTDDQGWRLEIKRYPRLTEIGGWRLRDGVREGGFYTQEDVREIVAHAAARGVEIMPEIELPGHATAAIAAYPELGCRREPLSVGTAWGIYANNYNAGDDRVFQFLEGVMGEVIELFPFGYVHLGADECLKDEWKRSADCQRRIAEEKLGDEHGLQTYFINRVASFLRGHGRIAVGWDEVLEGRISGDMIVECWRDEAIIKLALDRGYRVIASPRRYCYFDIAVSQLDLADVHAFDPSGGLPPAPNGAAVIGGEATLWTEYITEQEMDHMLFPRLLAMAEALWCGPQGKDPFPLFVRRARQVLARLQAAGIKPGPMLKSDGPAESMKGRTDLHVTPEGLDKLGLGE